LVAQQTPALDYTTTLIVHTVNFARWDTRRCEGRIWPKPATRFCALRESGPQFSGRPASRPYVIPRCPRPPVKRLSRPRAACVDSFSASDSSARSITSSGDRNAPCANCTFRSASLCGFRRTFMAPPGCSLLSIIINYL
jgi:hypothetical protein